MGGGGLLSHISNIIRFHLLSVIIALNDLRDEFSVCFPVIVIIDMDDSCSISKAEMSDFLMDSLFYIALLYYLIYWRICYVRSAQEDSEQSAPVLSRWGGGGRAPLPRSGLWVVRCIVGQIVGCYGDLAGGLCALCSRFAPLSTPLSLLISENL